METEKELFKDILGTKRLSEDEILAQAIVFFLAGKSYSNTVTIFYNFFIFFISVDKLKLFNLKAMKQLQMVS